MRDPYSVGCHSCGARTSCPARACSSCGTPLGCPKENRACSAAVSEECAAISKLLAWLNARDEAPTNWTHADKPDLLLQYPPGPVGVEITSLTVPRTAEASQRLSEVEDALRDRLDRGGAAWTLTISADVPPPNLDSAGLVRQQRAAIVEAASDLALEGGGTLDRRALSSSGVESVRELTLERGEAGVSVCLLTDGSHDLSQLRSVFASALEKKRSRR